MSLLSKSGTAHAWPCCWRPGRTLLCAAGWYESTDFWSPTLYRRYLHAPLKGDIELAHQAGALFTYVMNSGAMPLLDQFNELGFDIYSNIDPATPFTDFDAIKKKVGARMTLCGGVKQQPDSRNAEPKNRCGARFRTLWRNWGLKGSSWRPEIPFWLRVKTQFAISTS